MATRDEEQIEEERRLLYVAMTRARDDLALVQPLRFYVHHQPRRGDRHVYAPRSRFLPDVVLDGFETTAWGDAGAVSEDRGDVPRRARVDVAARMRAMWSP
jgi:DNA helicase-2/ATP-dependent DNA helicase PcrA